MGTSASRIQLESLAETPLRLVPSRRALLPKHESLTQQTVCSLPFFRGGLLLDFWGLRGLW